MKILFLVLLVVLPVAGTAQDRAEKIRSILQQHVIPGFITLSETTSALSQTAVTKCTANSEPLRAAFNDAFDAWMAVSHLQFGPLETNSRTFDLAFWPDPRSFTPKTLTKLINSEDSVVNEPEKFGDVSVAARGFYGLEFLLYDPTLSKLGSDAYRCQLIIAVTENLANTSAAVLADWEINHANLMLSPSKNGFYRTDDEVLNTFFNALSTGLQFTAVTRMGRPLGSFEKPRPNRAEARRSERSLRNVELSLRALDEISRLLSQGYPNVTGLLNKSFLRAQNTAAKLEEPVFSGVSAPQSRLKIEILQQNIEEISRVVATNLGPTLGVAAGFNSMDGD